MVKRLTKDQIKYAEQLLELEEFEPDTDEAETKFVAEDGKISDPLDVEWTPGLRGYASAVPVFMLIFSQELTKADKRALEASIEDLQEALEDESEDEDTLDEWRTELFQAKTKLATGEELVVAQSGDMDLRGAFVWLPTPAGDEYTDMMLMEAEDVERTAELWGLSF